MKNSQREKPVLFYYSPVTSGNKIIYINNILVLNDKKAGKILPAQYLAAAEKSKRIEEINMISLEKSLSDIEKNPSFVFINTVSARFLKETKINRLLGLTSGKEKNLVFAFNSLGLNEAGSAGAKCVFALKDKGVRVLTDGGEYGSLINFCRLQTDIVRLDGRLFSADKNLRLLDFFSGYCEKNGIQLIVKNTDTCEKLKFLQNAGVKYFEGKAAASPKRFISSLKIAVA